MKYIIIKILLIKPVYLDNIDICGIKFVDNWEQRTDIYDNVVCWEWRTVRLYSEEQKN